MEINAISSSYEMKIADQAVRHSREVQELTRKNRKEREANVLVKRELKSLQAECRQLKHTTEQMKQQMAKVEVQATRRINRAELWNEFRVRRLKNKLEKAVAGYPLDEVRKAGEELWTMTADPIFDADDTQPERFEYYRFEESPSEPPDEPVDSKAEESTV
jgi:TolA-binding protein